MSEMTREEAHTILASILRDRAAKCDEPQPCQDCELEAEALAALRQQDDPMAEYELWTCRLIVADTDAANDTALDALDAIWEKLTPEQREEANALGSRYAKALRQQAGQAVASEGSECSTNEPVAWSRDEIMAIATKADVQVRLDRQARLAAYVAELQATPPRVRVTIGALVDAGICLMAICDKGRVIDANAMLIALESLGLDVEVSDD